MKISPRSIYKHLKDGDLEKQSAINQLIVLINNSEDISIRIESIKILEEIGLKDDQIFNLYENLLISDTNELVRIAAINGIKNNFIEKAFKPMKWAFQHESSISCLIGIISTLGEINNDRAKSFLINRIKLIDIYKFNNSLDSLLKTEEIYRFTVKRLSEIINNYFVIKYFEEKFTDINYRLENGLVISLDLSGISNNVFGWNILRKLPEFIEVLKYLKKLDLKINRIAKLPNSIGTLNYLTNLDLSNNNLKNLPKSIGSLDSLESLCLKYNKITNSIMFRRIKLFRG